MKALDLILNALIVFSATVFLAHLGLLYDFGLFLTLPPQISGFFLDRPILQYLALAVAIGALVAKALLKRAIRTRHPAPEE